MNISRLVHGLEEVFDTEKYIWSHDIKILQRTNNFPKCFSIFTKNISFIFEIGETIIGAEQGLTSLKSYLLKISLIYCYWFNSILVGVCFTSKSRKYRRSPKSLTTNSCWILLMTDQTSDGEDPITILSFAYINTYTTCCS